MKNEKRKIKNAKNFDELLDIKYDKIGTKERDDFEMQAQKSMLEQLRDIRDKVSAETQNMTFLELKKYVDYQLQNRPTKSEI